MPPSKTVTIVLLGLQSALWRQHVLRTSPSTIQQEAWIGWLGWALVYIGFRVYVWMGHTVHPSPQDQDEQTHDGVLSRNLKIFGLSAVGVAVQLAQSRGVFAFVMPLVTLFALLITTKAQPEKSATHLQEDPEQMSEQHLQKPSALDKAFSRMLIPPCVPVNIVLCLLLAGSTSYNRVLISVDIAYSLLFLLGRTATFALVPRMSRINNSRPSDTEETIDWALLEKMSLSFLACFTLLLTLSVPTTFMLSPFIIMCAVTEVAWWFAVLFLSTNRLTAVATTLETVAASFDLSINSEQRYKAPLASVSALITLWQSVISIPPNHRWRNWLYLLALVPLYGILDQSKYIETIGSERQDDYARIHPIERIVLEARMRYSTMLDRQSKSLEQATKEYMRRHGREPPPYFGKWFELAQEHNLTLVDEFDVLMQSLEPFWGVPPSTLQTLCDNALVQLPEQLMKYEIRDHQVSVSQGGRSPWVRDSIKGWLPAEWLRFLPNMILAINVYDEPSTCVPRDALDRAMQLARLKASPQLLLREAAEQDPSRSPKFVDLGEQDAWEAMTLSCSVESPARNPECKALPVEGSLPFIRNVTQSRDICEHCELQSMEGFLFAPETLRLTHSIAPIWSQTKISSFNDIIFPSPYYWTRRGDYIESEDQNWESKDNQLYWVGAATGGHATESNWKHMQRQRMTILTKAGSTEPIRLLKESMPGIWTPYATNMSEVSSLFSTRIMGVTPQCEREACDAQKKAFGIGIEEVKDPVSAAYAHKLLLDMDGNTFSGRFYRLLDSKSMVIKQSLFVEWHDDRLIPWVHYVPVSTGFEELPELVRFFATTEKGQEIAAQIAEESKGWGERALRNVDLQLVWLRMLLEYGRIIDPSRS